MKNIVLIAGARPNFIKIAPIAAALRARGIAFFLVHTGQHYDKSMSEIFFKQLGIPEPDVNFEIGSGDRVTQTKKIVEALVPLLLERRPDAVLVVGDVTSTAAAALAGVQAGTPVIHVEAGLRSFNWPMPEELNRMIADHHSHHLFVTEEAGMENLRAEGIAFDRTHFVGNVMIDSLRKVEPLLNAEAVLTGLGLASKTYGVVTLHRPENVDNEENLRSLWMVLTELSERLPLVFPVHPRTRQRLESVGLSAGPNFRLLEPQGYLEMLALVKNAKVVLTDSGGLQEETTAFGVPCLTMRGQTERPVTVTVGTSEIVGRDAEKIREAFLRVMNGVWKEGAMPELWDGHAAERIADILADL